jgi:hypothetical protein
MATNENSMTREEYTKMWQQRAHDKEDYFCDHIATKSQYTDTLCAIDWRNKNNSAIYSVRYLFDSDRLIVTGDLGEAIFAGLSKKWWFEYFASDNFCYAVEKMRCRYPNNHRIDERVWENDFEQWTKDDEPSEKAIGEVSEIYTIYGKDFFEQMIFTNLSIEVEKELGSCSLDDISNFGSTHDPRTILMLEGLVMAISQLKGGEQHGDE